jgi:thymidylate synthase (FAD)
MSEAKLKVILLKHTPNPEEIVAMAAKLCYSPSDITSLREKIEAKDQKSFVEKLVKIGHMSPIEHTSFTFAIEGISRACSHQLVRHRLASYSQQSQRYVSEETGFDYIIPSSIKEDKELEKYFESAMKQAQEAYNHIVKKLNERGIKGESANQDARFVLPNAAETKIIVTMNARELLHFFRQRCCNRAQWEIRQMAREMLFLVKRVAPTIFEKAGPPCLYAPCPEGEMTCGQIKKVRKFYGSTYSDRKPKKSIKKTKSPTTQNLQDRLFKE